MEISSHYLTTLLGDIALKLISLDVTQILGNSGSLTALLMIGTASQKK